jgi:uncharacterized protein (TIGR02001 family)
MKKTTAILAASMVGFSGLYAQEELSVTASVEYVSHYVFRGIQFGEQYINSSVDMEFGGFYAGIWAAMPIDHADFNEVDFYAGYGWEVSEMVGADVGFTYYTFPDDARKFFDGDVNTFEIYAGLTFEVDFAPAAYIFYDFDLKAWTFEVSGGESWEVAPDTTFDLGLYGGYVRVRDFDNYWYLGTTAGFTYSINDFVSASAYLGYAWSSERQMFNDKKGRLHAGVSISAGF